MVRNVFQPATGWKIALALAAGLIMPGLVCAQTTTDPLQAGFENPPNSARPRVWWHWMNGNITREGIRLDLEWMHRVGLGGFTNFDAAMNTPQVVDHRIIYMSPEWKATFLYTTKLADRLGLEESIASSPGWSETGGPWVPASEGMKKYVWSETRLDGGKPFEGILTMPPQITGPFQNIPLVPDQVMPGERAPSIPASFYRDSAVFAYRLPAGDVPLAELHPKITTSGGEINAEMLTDGDFAKSVELPSAPVGKEAWIEYSFDKPTRIQSVSLTLGPAIEPPEVSENHGESEVFLEVSEDGERFRRVTRIDAGDVGTTLDFPALTSRYFRVAFLGTPPMPVPNLEDDPDGWMGVHTRRTDAPHFERIAELVLSPAARVQRYQEKAAFATDDDLYRFATPQSATDSAIEKSDVIDLSASMQPNGMLTWTPPPGRWVIVRMGYSLLGITNHPATAEATGLEVDKLHREYVKSYMDNYLNSYKLAVGSKWMGQRGIRYVVTDSWEAGAQNWTDDMLAEFKKRRGYRPQPWLPVLTGHIVESAEASDAFLWDLRKTISDLTAAEHYAQVEDSLKVRKIGHYGESHESGRAMIADGMEVKKLDDIPMGAMWAQSPGVNNDLFGYNADDRESASVAHIYGQNIAAAESMTAVHAPWAWSPATLKPTADKELAEGINRFVIHCSTHQPLVGTAPGLGLGPYGQWFNRNETWAEEARPWVDYLSRNSYLLQQGYFVADVLYFYGEDSNVTAIFGNKSPSVPEGYSFDYVNADAITHEFFVKDGRLVTASGMSYQILALDSYSVHMSLPVLKAIRTLVQAGATLVGTRPLNTPSLADDRTEFAAITEELWGSGPGLHAVGKGRVYVGMSLGDALLSMKVNPDFSYTKPATNTSILYVHRTLSNADIYFVDHRNNDYEQVDASFRIQGKVAEVWHADTGKKEDVSYRNDGSRTTVPLRLGPWESVFVVFRRNSHVVARTMPVLQEQQGATLDGPWKVSFKAGRGAPSNVMFSSLTSWSENADQGIRYFSGTATYRRTIDAPVDWFKPGTEVWIDLGDVKNLAAVTVNRKAFAAVWHEPYRTNVTQALRPGANEIEIKVTNAWVNRIIGDLQPDATEKYTFLVIHPYAADSPLLPSGLLGPVRIVLTAPAH